MAIRLGMAAMADQVPLVQVPWVRKAATAAVFAALVRWH
jgi:hypothetical protein